MSWRSHAFSFSWPCRSSSVRRGSMNSISPCAVVLDELLLELRQILAGVSASRRIACSLQQALDRVQRCAGRVGPRGFGSLLREIRQRPAGSCAPLARCTASAISPARGSGIFTRAARGLFASSGCRSFRFSVTRKVASACPRAASRCSIRASAAPARSDRNCANRARQARPGWRP